MNEDELIFDEDEYSEVESPQLEQPTVQTSTEQTDYSQPTDDSDLTSDVLRILGISDPNKILFVDDSGAVIERSWDSLNRNEQLAILTQHDDLETSLDDDEISLINSIRTSKLSPEQYLNQMNQQYLNQYQDSQIPQSSVDDMSDDYLFVLDLMDKVGEENITDEELEEALNNAKTNEALFKKTVDGLRTQYKNREQEIFIKNQENLQNQRQQLYDNFVNRVTYDIDNLKYFADHEIELSPDDKEELADYLLTIDNNGYSQFGLDMSDPQKMVQVAFFVKKGPEILNELSKLIQEAFKRGYSKARQDIENKSTIVINPYTNKQQSTSFFDSDEDDWD